MQVSDTSMQEFFFARPAEHSFSRRPEDVIRVEIVRLYNLALDKISYHWCDYGTAHLEEIPLDNVVVQSVQMAAESLAKSKKWTLLKVSV